MPITYEHQLHGRPTGRKTEVATPHEVLAAATEAAQALPPGRRETAIAAGQRAANRREQMIANMNKSDKWRATSGAANMQVDVDTLVEARVQQELARREQEAATKTRTTTGQRGGRPAKKPDDKAEPKTASVSDNTPPKA